LKLASAHSLIADNGITILLKLTHVNDAADAVAGVHVVEGLVDAAEWLAVGDEFVDLQLAGHVVVDEVGELSAAFDAAESAALPYAAGDELESCERERLVVIFRQQLTLSLWGILLFLSFREKTTYVV
jgi:hypothetical protein